MTYPDLHNDPSIPDETLLRRCIPAIQVVPDPNSGRVRPSGAAFTDNGNGDPMSAYIASECEGEERVRSTLPGLIYIASFTAGLARSCGQGVVRDPANGGPGHVVVVGNKKFEVNHEGKQLQARQVMAVVSCWVVGP